MKLVHIDSVSATETFNITAGALRVTDPCYDMDTWCAGTLDKVRNGAWDAHVGYHRDKLDMEMSEKYRQNRVDKMQATEDEIMKEFYAQDIARYDELHAKYLGRVAYIHIVAQGFEHKFNSALPLDDEWQLADIDVGVDSGQAGFFDVAQYALSVSTEEKEKPFYDCVCDLTLDYKSFGTVSFGAVSSSGYGDGGYNCYYRRNSLGEVIEAVIVFIAEYHEDDEELAA